MTGPVEKILLGRWGYSHDEVPDLEGKTIIVTGASAGIGFEVAKALAAHKAKVIATGRPVQIEAAKKAMAGGATYVNSANVTGLNDPQLAASQVQWEAVDHEDLNDVHRLATSLAKQLDRLDVLICNAGIGVNQFKPTKDGWDRHLTINNLAHIVLINHLLPLLRKTAEMPDTKPGSVRIVQQSSELHRPETFRDVPFESVEEFKQDVGSASEYDRTKLANILFGKALATNVLTPDGDKILSFSTHPGAVATDQQEQVPEAFGAVVGTAIKSITKPLARTPEHGSLCILWASVAPEASEHKQGSYFTDPKEPGKESSKADDDKLAQNFWRTSQEVIKQVTGPEGLIDWNQKA